MFEYLALIWTLHPNLLSVADRSVSLELQQLEVNVHEKHEGGWGQRSSNFFACLLPALLC